MSWRAALLLLAVAAAAPEIRYFQYQRPLGGPSSHSTQTCAVLDSSIFAHAAPQLADLRLYRGSGESGSAETPFVIQIAASIEQRQSTIPPLNLGSRNGQTVFDAAMPEGRYRYSDLDLYITGKDFIATVTVSGTETQGTQGATKLGSFTIFDLTGQKLGRSTVLHLPESDFRYLHFQIAGPVTPQSITGLSVERLPESQTPYVTVAESSQLVQKGYESTLQFQVAANVPVDRIEFLPGPEPKNFTRAITVKVEPVQRPHESTESAPLELIVFGGNLLRVHGTHDGHRIDEEHLVLGVYAAEFSTSAAHWTVTIDNGDDAPLPLRSVRLEMAQRRLCFDGAAGASYTLFYGDAALSAPRYDYAMLFMPEADAAQATLGPEQKNPRYQPRPDQRPFSEKHPALLWIALVFVVVVLGAVALRTARQTAPAPK